MAEMGTDEAVEYHSKDFEWEELRRTVESDNSLCYHFSPFQPSSSSASACSEDSQAWSDFHTRHSTGKFFKERRYLLKEFPELVSCADYSKVLEVGCGNGSTVLPILRSKENVTVVACDCSMEALERAKANIGHAKIAVRGRFHTFCCDFSTMGFPKWLTCDSCRESETSLCQYSDVETECDSVSKLYLTRDGSRCIGGVDFITLIFTLSAVPLQRMPMAVKECFSVLKSGGMVFFRDYGLYDMTMLRFEPEKRVGFREYMRNDGTRSYFFSLDSVRDLFLGAGFIVIELEYCCIKSVNRRKGKSMNRVWVHGKFQKPVIACGSLSEAEGRDLT